LLVNFYVERATGFVLRQNLICVVPGKPNPAVPIGAGAEL